MPVPFMPLKRLLARGEADAICNGRWIMTVLQIPTSSTWCAKELAACQRVRQDLHEHQALWGWLWHMMIAIHTTCQAPDSYLGGGTKAAASGWSTRRKGWPNNKGQITHHHKEQKALVISFCSSWEGARESKWDGRLPEDYLRLFRPSAVLAAFACSRSAGFPGYDRPSCWAIAWASLRTCFVTAQHDSRWVIRTTLPLARKLLPLQAMHVADGLVAPGPWWPRGGLWW